MTKPVKKHLFMLPFARIFTRAEGDAYDQIAFQSSESFGDEQSPALAAPQTWDAQAVAVMAAAACANIPASLHAVEENTVPSWLWRHQPRGKQRAAEGDLRDIFNRAVGSAAAKGWKLGLFSSEKHARAFYDETRYALMQRQIVIAPDVIADWGLNWAYGNEIASPLRQATAHPAATSLTNAAIDAVIGKTQSTNALWKSLFTVEKNEVSKVSLSLSDIAADWHSDAPTPARALIDVMALRHNDGNVNIDALRQTARLLTILLDLQDSADVTVGVANLAPLLLALGLGYDSDAGRALAASITALITAECYATSAEMAGLRGESQNFAAHREQTLRSLRNHRRAAYGDSNDYEKLSVAPAPLPLKNCPDLNLLAEAQRRWDDALDQARAFGLRAIQVTDLTPSPLLAVLSGSITQSLEPLPRLTILQQQDNDTYRTLLHPAVQEALTRLSYPRSIAAAITQHINGTHSLRKTPVINFGSLRAKGFNDSAIEKIEAYLPCVNSLRLAVTPWIVGLDFCRTQLKIPAHTLEAPRFDLLKHLGFSDADIATADKACYGFGTMRNAKILHLRHRPLFACGLEIAAEARLRMAASVQSFVSGDTGVIVTLPTAQSTVRGAEIALSAWKNGLKSVTLIFDPEIPAKPVAIETKARRLSAASQPQAKVATTIARNSRSGKNGATLVVKKSRPTHKAH